MGNGKISVAHLITIGNLSCTHNKIFMYNNEAFYCPHNVVLKLILYDSTHISVTRNILAESWSD